MTLAKWLSGPPARAHPPTPPTEIPAAATTVSATEVFVLCAFTGDDDHVGVDAVSLNVTTFPFGASGGNVLSVGGGAQPTGATDPRPSLPR